MLTKGCAMIIMFLQTHHTHRLSRLITTSVYGLLVSLLLCACGGGGGGGGASPVVSGGPAIQTGRADLLFNGLAQTNNLADAGYVVDTDSGQVRLFSNRTEMEQFLVKQPEPRFFSSRAVASDLARGVFIPASSSAVSNTQTHGKFMIWGRALTAMPSTLNTLSRLDYTMTGAFHCQSCATKQGVLTGSLSLGLDLQATILRLSGDGLEFSQYWQLGKNAGLAPLGSQNASLRIGNVAQNIEAVRGQGGLFGENAQSAGMVFSMDYNTPSDSVNQPGTANTGQINGLALGQRLP